MITWEDIFGILKKMFNKTQSQIADSLGVEEHIITKIKKGNLNPTFANEDIYQKIFDPNTPDSPANDSEKYLLILLEEIIENEFEQVKETMKDYWIKEDKYKVGDYKVFVIKMLERTIYISSSKSKTVLPDSNNATVSNLDSGGAQLSIPDKYNICLFCTYWKGNTSHACKSKIGVDGTCKMYEREQISTGGMKCKNYEPDYSRISCQELIKPMAFLL